MESIESGPASPSPRTVSVAVADGREARAAISDVVDRLEPLRNRAIFIGAKVRHATRQERPKLAEECRRIELAIGDARTELIIRLMDAPPSVAGHSRVLDVEKAIDSLERSLEDVRLALMGG